MGDVEKDQNISRKVIWSKGEVILGLHPDHIRRDRYGFWMMYNQYRTSHPFAWDIEEKVESDPTKGSTFYPVALYPKRGNNKDLAQQL
jgi:hypothetical protein